MSTQDLAPAARADLPSASAGTVEVTPVDESAVQGCVAQGSAVQLLDELLVEEISIDGMCGVY